MDPGDAEPPGRFVPWAAAQFPIRRSPMSTTMIGLTGTRRRPRLAVRRATRRARGAGRRPVAQERGQRLGRGRPDLERHGREDARPRPAARVGSRRRSGGGLRPRERPPHLHQGTRSQHRRHLDRRGRPRPRHVEDGPDRGRSRGQAGSRGAGLQAPGRRPRDPGARPRNGARLHLGGGCRRPDARRGAGLPRAALRLDGRQPPGGRDRHRRRDDPHGASRRERGALLGATRRRRELRGRHPVHLPAP